MLRTKLTFLLAFIVLCFVQLQAQCTDGSATLIDWAHQDAGTPGQMQYGPYPGSGQPSPYDETGTFTTTTCNNDQVTMTLNYTGNPVSNTNGIAGLDYRMTQNLNGSSTLKLSFSKAVIIDDLKIGDVDAKSGYVDRLVFSAKNGASNVSVNLTAGSGVNVSGQTAVGATQDGGTLSVSTSQAVTEITMDFSNGNGAGGYQFVLVKQGFKFCCPITCAAGDNAPMLTSSTNFDASNNTYTIPCGSAVANLSSLNATNVPGGSIMTFHSANPATDLNKVAPVYSLQAGTYYVSFFDPKGKCYSSATQQVTVVKENCAGQLDCSEPLAVNESCTTNACSNVTSLCPARYDKLGRMLFFDWQGQLQNGQTSTVTCSGVEYKATVSNYEGTSDVVNADDLDVAAWPGAKMKYMYSDGVGGKNEGWYMAGNANGEHSWRVTVEAKVIATGQIFPVNLAAFDMESTSNNEYAQIQSLDGANWTLVDQYRGTCDDRTDFGLGNLGQGILDGVGTTTITYNDTENNGGNSIWMSQGATMVDIKIQSGGGRQGAGVALYLDCDTDGDGIPDKYEAAISGTVKDDAGNALSGATLELFNSASTSLGTVTSGADGSFKFENVPPGTGYKVVETDPAGYASDSDSQGGNDNTVENIEAHYAYNSCSVAFVDKREVGTISGSVMEDTDGNGIGDVALTGVQLALLDSNGNPVTDNNGNPITTMTNANGSFSFENVPTGTGYQVVETDPNNLVSSSDTEGANDNRITGINVVAGQENGGNNFVDVKPVSIGGKVLADENANGTADTPLQGVVVNLLDGNGNPVLDSNGNPITTMTNASGEYVFEGLKPGSYQIQQVQPNGYNSIGDTDGNATENIVNVNASTPGTSYMGQDFTEVNAVALPITLKSFEAKAEGLDAVLNWVTASELNNDKFVVEYSLDAKQYAELAVLKGNGTSIEENSYSFVHEDAAKLGSVVYYRLKQVDFDAKYEYVGTIKAVAFDKVSKSDIILKPSVISQGEYIYVDGITADQGTYSIYNSSGQLLMRENYNEAAQIIIRTDILHNGLFHIVFADGSSAKFVVE